MEQVRLNELAFLLKDRADAGAVYVFGSFATGRFRDDSDLDLAFMTRRDVDRDELFTLQAELAAIAGREVDLVKFSDAPEPLQAEILRQGILVASWDENLRATQAMQAMSRYQRLNEERRPSLDLRLGKDGWKRLS